jgi:hypothetical protein
VNIKGKKESRQKEINKERERVTKDKNELLNEDKRKRNKGRKSNKRREVNIKRKKERRQK